ncbi:20401_t:CDS:2, partial [Dentiscutata erythropus]
SFTSSNLKAHDKKYRYMSYKVEKHETEEVYLSCLEMTAQGLIFNYDLPDPIQKKERPKNDDKKLEGKDDTYLACHLQSSKMNNSKGMFKIGYYYDTKNNTEKGYENNIYPDSTEDRKPNNNAEMNANNNEVGENKIEYNGEPSSSKVDNNMTTVKEESKVYDIRCYYNNRNKIEGNNDHETYLACSGNHGEADKDTSSNEAYENDNSVKLKRNTRIREKAKIFVSKVKNALKESEVKTQIINITNEFLKVASTKVNDKGLTKKTKQAVEDLTKRKPKCAIVLTIFLVAPLNASSEPY